MVVPGTCDDPALGSCATTLPFGELSSTRFVATAKPAPWRIELALSTLCPTTLGTAIGCGPFDTLRWTTDPWSTVAPAFGVCEMTVPLFSFELTCAIF